MAAQGKSVTILCSYVTLGTYIPALILHREFKQKGFDSELIALEQLFPDNKLDEIPKLKKAIHNNFKLAKTALKMASKNNSASFDENKVKALFSDWNEKKRNHFIVFTGFWSEIINRFIGNAASYQDIQVDLVHMDSESSPSWKSYETSYGNIRLIKLFDAARKQLHGYIPPAENQFTNIRSKKDRILVHGGGWGIGTYKEKVFEMVSHKLRLNVVAYEPADMQCDNESIQYHLLDPQWKPYNGQFYTFPPIRRMGAVEKEYGSDDGYYPYYNLVLDSCVILSKPGGGTLNDSISSGVPVVFLEPFGDHEACNARLWRDLGYGIDYGDWKESGFSEERINALRINLKEGKKKLKTIYQNYYENPQ